MVIELSGQNERLNNGIEYLKGLGVAIQSLAQDVKWDEQKCIHCTACISLCPSHALSVDRSQMLVSFNPDRCIVCGLCLKACPYHAIEIQF
ncbi:4Fe-4S binding protein [Candidatus Desantisbacteria bacterium]|nr:4Fe-4S binding protein [Candidatus Desantisbacteria bacterium]